MKQFFILLLLAGYTITGHAQNINDYYYADRIALSIPSSKTNTTTDIAAYLNTNLDTDHKKVRAIYTWVAVNIRYNTDSLHPVIFEEDRELRVAIALRRRKGVCENYASIFNDICIKSGLRSLIVEGYTKQSGLMDKSPHAWCTVFIDDTWQLYDPTWDESRASRGVYTGSMDYEYFERLPAEFIQSHMPFDPMFQLLNYPVTYKEFYNGNVYENSKKPYFSYIDSLALYEKLNPLDKYLSAALRIEKNGSPSAMITNKKNQLKMDIEIIRQDNDTTLYNAAVADYNKALALFNTFITYRNNLFTPSKSDYEIQDIFDGIVKKIAAGNTKLKEVNNSRAVLTLNTNALEEALKSLSAKTIEQQNFLKEYLSSVKQD